MLGFDESDVRAKTNQSGQSHLSYRAHQFHRVTIVNVPILNAELFCFRLIVCH